MSEPIVRSIDVAYLVGSGAVLVVSALPILPPAFARLFSLAALALALTVLAGLWDLYRTRPRDDWQEETDDA